MVPTLLPVDQALNSSLENIHAIRTFQHFGAAQKPVAMRLNRHPLPMVERIPNAVENIVAYPGLKGFDLVTAQC